MTLFLKFSDYINYMYYLHKVLGGEFKKVPFFINHIDIFFSLKYTSHTIL